VFRSYYYLAKVPGRVEVDKGLQGIVLDDRAAVVFCPNDVSGVLEALGDEQGEGPREESKILAMRMAVNLVVYALTVNYKLDQVHVSYHLRHPDLYPRLRAPMDELQR